MKQAPSIAVIDIAAKNRNLLTISRYQRNSQGPTWVKQGSMNLTQRGHWDNEQQRIQRFLGLKEDIATLIHRRHKGPEQNRKVNRGNTTILAPFAKLETLLAERKIHPSQGFSLASLDTQDDFELSHKPSLRIRSLSKAQGLEDLQPQILTYLSRVKPTIALSKITNGAANIEDDPPFQTFLEHIYKISALTEAQPESQNGRNAETCPQPVSV